MACSSPTCAAQKPEQELRSHAGQPRWSVGLQVVDELFSYWTLEDSEDTLEQLEELLIVRAPRMPSLRCPLLARSHSLACAA